jgi:hypothetical protein
VTVLSFASALLFALAACVEAYPLEGRDLARPARLLGWLGALAQLPLLFDDSQRARALACIGVSLLAPASPAFLLAACLAFLSWMGDPGPGGIPVLFVSCAAVAAGRAVSREARATLVGESGAEWAGAASGLLGALLVLSVERGGVVSWRLALGGAPLPGVSLLLGIAFLLCFLGGLLLAASALAGSGGMAGLLGRRALVLACGFMLLGAGLGTLLRLPPGPPVAHPLVRLWAAAGLLVLGVMELVRLEDRAEEGEGGTDTGWALLLALVALVAAGIDAWTSQGTVLGGAVPGLLAATLLGLGAWKEGPLPLARTATFVLGLAYLLVVRA